MGLSIANRILLGFAIITFALIGVGVYMLVQMGEVQDNTETTVSRDIAALSHLDRIKTAERDQGKMREQTVINALLGIIDRAPPSGEDTVAEWQRNSETLDNLLSEMSASARQFSSTATSAQRSQSWRKLAEALEKARGDERQIRAETLVQFEAVRTGNYAGVSASEAKINDHRARFFANLDDGREAVDMAIDVGRTRTAEIYATSQTAIIAAIVVAALAAIAISFLIRQSITSQLQRFSQFAERVGRGDLAERAPESTDEMGRLAQALNGMVDGLRQLTRQSREATENLNAAAAEIRASTQEQAASVEEQLAAVQETAATVDEITHAGGQIGKRAQEVIATAQMTAETSNAGLRAVDDAMHAMDSIRDQAEAVAENIVALSEKTQAIGEIILTVNDVSERSHLLALNAAIEAAAAGEAGRSFAVVASEMKMLADQAKEATVQVRAILGDIQRGINSSVMLTEEAVKRVSAGKQQTETTQRTIEEISGRVQESVHTFQQIVASTNQQQLGIEQVMGALQNIRQGSQQTAAGTRQLDQAAANLTQLSEQLVSLTERYRL
ncbi:methyl-accepting chemotaxis protein [Iodidimonas sp. SYSU 1G8]|uniref:methyl-accepting chemotaxis protein n=1 Tax=Iodidimonas sp. SYSU 1G8 TaxID=3133967 RepID=UPI0031FF00A0